MTFEQLLLIAALILLPLIQILRAGFERERSAKGPVTKAPASLPLPPIQQPAPAQHRQAITSHSLSKEVDANYRVPSGDGFGRDSLNAAVRGTPRHGPIAHLRNPAGLRSAVVMMTILAPCRGQEPLNFRD